MTVEGGKQGNKVENVHDCDDTATHSAASEITMTFNSVKLQCNSIPNFKLIQSEKLTKHTAI